MPARRWPEISPPGGDADALSRVRARAAAIRRRRALIAAATAALVVVIGVSVPLMAQRGSSSRSLHVTGRTGPANDDSTHTPTTIAPVAVGGELPTSTTLAQHDPVPSPPATPTPGTVVEPTTTPTATPTAPGPAPAPAGAPAPAPATTSTSITSPAHRPSPPTYRKTPGLLAITGSGPNKSLVVVDPSTGSTTQRLLAISDDHPDSDSRVFMRASWTDGGTFFAALYTFSDPSTPAEPSVGTYAHGGCPTWWPNSCPEDARLDGFSAYNPAVGPDDRFFATALINNDGTQRLSVRWLPGMLEEQCSQACNAMRYSDISGISWAPDGQHLAFAGRATPGGPEEIHVVGWEGSADHVIAIGTTPSWSPDGTRIAYSVTNSQNTQDIWIAGTDGSDPKQLTHDGANDITPVWSPDASTIAYTHQTTTSPATATIWAVALNTSTTHQISAGPNDFVQAWR